MERETRNGKREIGCGLWLVWLFLALFAAEWLLLWVVLHEVSQKRLVLMVLIVTIATIIGGWIAVFFRLRRRPR